MPDLEALIKHDCERLASQDSPVPKGYLFVPKGDVYVTRHCRDKTVEAGKILYIVFDRRKQQRTGLRCPLEVYRQVQTANKATASARQAAVEAKDKRDIEAARKTLLRLFPRIPLMNAEQILAHGYSKGSGRVGRVTTLDDDQRCTLAVIAHSRHVLTPYDKLLKDLEGTCSREKAREKAREAIKDTHAEVLRAWRGPIAKSEKTETTRTVGTEITRPVKIATTVTMAKSKTALKSGVETSVHRAVRKPLQQISKPDARSRKELHSRIQKRTFKTPKNSQPQRHPRPGHEKTRQGSERRAASIARDRIRKSSN